MISLNGCRPRRDDCWKGVIVTSKFYAFRTDLEVTPRIVDGERLRHFVMDIDTEEVFEFGEKEYFLCSRLDGKHSIDQVRKDFENEFNSKLDLVNLQEFIEKLRWLGLLSNETVQPWEKSPPIERGTVILYSDYWMRWFSEIFSWCFSKKFLVCVLCVFCIIVYKLVISFGDLLYELQIIKNIYSAGIFVLVPIFGLMFVLPFGEISKGIACKYYGGYVSTVRVRFFYHFIPNFYVDIVDSLWFFSKKKRALVLTAGLFGQGLLLIFSVLGWLSTMAWSVMHNFFTLLTIASVLFTFLNISPFMQRDGYFFLVNHIEKENLSDRARKIFFSRLFFNPMPEPLSENDKKLFFWFGFFSVLSRALLVVLFLGLAGFALIKSFNGVGASLFFLIIILRFERLIKKQWLKTPIIRRMLKCQNGAVRMRLLVKLSVLIVIAVVLFLPYPFEVGGGFRILPASQQGIRAEAAGTITEILVAENQIVKNGQAVAKIDTRDYLNKIDVIWARINETQAVIDLRKSGGKPEEIAAAAQLVEVGRENLEYSEKEELRYKQMWLEKAIPETEYKLVEHKRDLDKASLQSALNTLELIKSGAKDEEIEALEAKLQRLEIELFQAQGDLEHTTLLSPIDGVIITPNLSQRVGQRLEKGDLLGVVEDNGKIIAEIEVSENDIGEIVIGAQVKLRTWADPLRTFRGKVIAVAPVAYEKSWHRFSRTLSEREQLLGQKEILRDQGKVIRVLSELPDDVGGIKSDMTGYAKIESGSRPVGIAFSRWLVRLIFVEIWSWIP